MKKYFWIMIVSNEFSLKILNEFYMLPRNKENDEKIE